MKSKGNLDAKMFFITALFESLEQKTAFAEELYSTGHQDEALTLACCYIDGIANNVYRDSQGTAKNFATLLISHGKEKSLALHSARSLVRWIEASRPRLLPAAAAIEAKLGSEIGALHSPPDFEELLRTAVAPSDWALVSAELWRASGAAVVHKHMRSEFIHNLYGVGGILLGDEQIAPQVEIEFPVILRALQSIVAHFKDVSLRTGMWFGHDHRAAEDS